MALNRSFTVLLLSIALIVPASLAWTDETPSQHDEIVHVLNRITFGPRPGDVEMVEKMGVQAYIQQQLHPETINDSVVDKEISQLALLQMTPQELAIVYENDYGREAKQEKKEKKLAKNAPDVATPATNPPGTTPMQPTNETAMTDEAVQGKRHNATKADKTEKANEWHTDAAVGQIEKGKLVRAIDSQRQLQEVLVDFWNNHFNIDVKKKSCRVTKIVDDRDVIRPNIWGSFRDLLGASAKSPAMLYYLDNAKNTAPAADKPGKQKKALQVADTTPPTSPAPMVSSTPAMTEPAPTKVALAPQTKRKQRGINENYAREIMELHTMGVDTGYTQEDVQEVARCFTGWGVDKDTGEFAFHARFHDNGEKTVLGHKIPAGGGIKDGEMVLDILCSQPATAHHISFQLCQRFVADNPPPALVDRVAGVFTQTGGDLRKVTAAILTSPEFLSPASYRNKIKSPFEFTVSAVRASGATIVAQLPPPLDKTIPRTEGKAILAKNVGAADKMDKQPEQSLNWHIFELGEPLFACTPPTGYKEDSSTWVSPGALIERLNFAMALTNQKVSDIQFDPKKVLGQTDLDKPDAVLNQCVSVYLQGDVSPGTRKVLLQNLPVPGDSQTVNPSKLIALIIGSPEFQRK